MEQVLIIVNAEVNEQGKIVSASPVTERMVAAIRKGIANYSSVPTHVEVVAAGSLWSKGAKSVLENSQLVYCPLTIQLPEYLDFPAKEIYAACRDIGSRRSWVEQKLGYKTSVGDSWLGHLWLPVVLTAKGPLYAEVIGEGAIPNSYEQPIDLPDNQRQSLYYLAYNLLDSLAAPPAVYLVQFSLYANEIVFDRLWPFPAAPALASLKTQEPDLYACHWCCLTDRPILDLAILATKIPT